MTTYRFQFVCSSRYGSDWKVYGGGYMGERFVIDAEDGEGPTGYMRWQYADKPMPLEVLNAFIERTSEEHRQWYARAMREAKDDINRRIAEEINAEYGANRILGTSRWISGEEWEITYQFDPAIQEAQK